MSDVLSTTNTCSMATLGTSAIRMRRSALASAGSAPTRSNSTAAGEAALTRMLRGGGACVRVHVQQRRMCVCV
jgi:hypothetical protein